MRRLLIITGDLATGKSTFAGILSARWSVCHFTKDSIKEVLGDAVGFSNRAENKRLSNAAVNIMAEIFAEASVHGRDLILEANFHADELSVLRGLAEKRGYAALALALRGDAEVLYQRYMHRATRENRHPVHLSTTLDVYADFVDYLRAGRAEELGEPAWVVDAGDFGYQTDEALLARLDAFMAGEAPNEGKR